MFVTTFGNKGIANTLEVDSLMNVYHSSSNLDDKLEAVDALIEHYKSFDLDSAILFCVAYEELVSTNDDQLLIAKNSAQFASVYSLSGDFGKMSPYAYKALEIYKSQKNDEGQINIHLILGRMFASKKEFDKAYESYNDALDVANGKYPEQQVSINLGISNAKFLEKKGDEATVYLFKCLDILKTHQFQDSAKYLAKIYTNLGNVSSAGANDPEALKYYKKSFSYYKLIGDKFGISLTAFNIGDTYFFNNEFDSALVYFKITEKMGHELHNYEELYYAYLGYTEVYEGKQEFDSAFYFQQIKFAYKDSLQQQKYDENVVDLEKKYNLEKHANELASTEEKLIASEREKKQNESIIWILAIAGGLFIFASLALLIFYSRAKKASEVIRLQSESIKEYNLSIDKALKQKDTLLKEVHHRVKNNLQLIASLLNLQLNKLENEEARKALEESKSRVLAIALMHKGLYQDDNFGTVNVKEYLDELIEHQKVLSISNHKRVEFDINIEELKFTIDQAIPTGLIISELISNSFKHAFALEPHPEITLSLKRIGEKFQITYMDNGIGLPDGFILEEQDSLGFIVIVALTEQLDGILNIESKTPLRLTVTF